MLKPFVTSVFLVAASLLMCSCDRRATAEAQFIGTWNSSACIDCTFDLTLFPDHTFISSGESLGRYCVNDTGTWHLDYKRIFLRRKDIGEHGLVIMNIADVTPAELKITHADYVETYRRVKAMTREEIQNMVGKAKYTTTP